MLPAIWFDESNKVSFKTFENFINFLDTQENDIYKYYHKITQDINENINTFNEKANLY